MIDEWINHPAIQSGLIPFVAAFISVALLNYLRLSGLAVIAGFCATVYFVADFNFESLSIVKKIILAGLIAATIAPLLDLISNYVRFTRHVIVLASGCVAIWVFWSVLKQKPLEEAAMYGVGLAAYSMILAAFIDWLASTPARAGPTGLSLGLATGALALLGASALLGQLGFAVGMACGAYTLYALTTGKSLSCGRTFTLPLTILCGLIAPAAMILAKLPWIGLPLLLVIPLVAYFPLPSGWSIRWQISIFSIVTLISATIPVYIVWWHSGGVLF